MLGNCIEAVERHRKRLVLYSQAGSSDLVDRLATRNVTVEHRQLPPTGPDPFVVVHDRETFAGVLCLDDLELFLTPPIVRPGRREGLSEGYRVLLDLLDETLFSALSRRQLLATSREIEDRALRTGRGTLRVGFQSLSVFRTQIGLYRRLAAETELQIHVYGEPDWAPPAIEGITYHGDRTGRLSPFWCLAFDGGGTEAQACALVAREREDGYVGFWTYDPEFVAEILETLEVAGATD
jgi:hypothetical protein